MTNYLNLLLILFGACSHLIPPALAWDRSKITWTNSIATTKELKDYLSSSHDMARDVLTPNADNSSLVLGPKPSGELTLAVCLETIKSGRKDGQSLFLDVTTMDIYKKAIHVLKDYVKTEKWITLNLVMFKGPNGNEPKFPAKVIKAVRHEWPSINLRISFSMTHCYNGQEQGYSTMVVKRFFAEWSMWGFNKIPAFGFALDIYHLSYTQPIILDRMCDYLRLVKQIQLYTNEEMQDKVNMPVFNKFLVRMDIEQCYFNVPKKFRERLNLENIHGDGAGAGVRGCGAWMMLVFGMILILGLN